MEELELKTGKKVVTSLNAKTVLQRKEDKNKKTKKKKLCQVHFLKSIFRNKLSKFKFSWQEGYGAFSYNHTQVDDVVKYIMNQKEHHRKVTFKDEYIGFLKKFNIEHDEKYLFDWIG